ncbi:unnamed protein product [Arabis nemorensis]|uniref:FAE domain-containing protein n=1 Tax=Arabis nemorensis TaxID=586526 RepID=A0A565BD96_9BRAS|nr:unnamed protein product [Arabis nemorensis]
MVNLKLLYHFFITHFFKLFLFPFVSFLFFHNLWFHLQHNLVTLTIFSVVLAFGSAFYCVGRPKPVYLVDYSCHLPPPHLKATIPRIIDGINKVRESNPSWNELPEESSLDFLVKILERSGLGDETYVPEAITRVPPQQTMAAAREETEQVIFDAINNLLANTKVNSHAISA